MEDYVKRMMEEYQDLNMKIDALEEALEDRYEEEADEKYILKTNLMESQLLSMKGYAFTLALRLQEEGVLFKTILRQE